MAEQTILERVGNVIAQSAFGRAIFTTERREIAQAFEQLVEGYYEGPFTLQPPDLRDRLAEYDSSIIHDLVDRSEWDLLGGYGLGRLSDEERYRSVQQSEALFRYSPLAQWCIWLWGGWGLGDAVIVSPNDESAQKVWTEFWEADRNQALLGGDRIGQLSNWLLVTGERFLVFFTSEMDGESTVRIIEPEEITEIITNPDDSSTPWFYKREYSITLDTGATQPATMYYPDWGLFLSDKDNAVAKAWDKLVQIKAVSDKAKRSDEIMTSDDLQDRTGTVAVILHIAHNQKDRRSLRGWPIATAAAPWLRSHKRFASARLATSMAVNAIVRRYTVQGGSRAVGSVRSSIASSLSGTNYNETNPPPSAGGSEVMNDAMKVQDLPLKTGASDAKTDGEMFSWIALLGMGIFPTSAGLDTARWATALEMDKAQSMLFQSYQNFWSAQFQRIVKIVLGMAERYSGATFTDKTSAVSVDAFSLSDFPGIAFSLGKLVGDMLTPYATNNILPPDTVKTILRDAWVLSLQALGINDPEMLLDETWGIGVEPEPAPAPTGDAPADAIPADDDTPTELAKIIRANVKENPALGRDALILELLEVLDA